MSYIYTYDGTNSSTYLKVDYVWEFLFYLKETLKQAGWTVIRSSDGVTVSTSSDIITSVAAGAGGFQNTYAWFVIKQPGSSRQILFYKQNINGYSYNYGAFSGVAVLYSYSAGFTGGSASSRPTATDEAKVIFDESGGGKPVVPCFPIGSIYAPQTNVAANYRAYIAADNTAPYGWYAFFMNSSGSPAGLWMFDPLAPSSYSSQDVDPYIFSLSAGTYYYSSGWVETISNGAPSFWSNGMGLEANVNISPRGYFKKGLSGEAWNYMPAMSYYSGAGAVSVPGGIHPNQYTGEDSIFPIFYGRRSGLTNQVGLKGMGTVAQWVGCRRNTGDTLSISGPSARDKIVCGDLALPWNGSVPKI